jgi:ATP-dependent DNA helicase RecQ
LKRALAILKQYFGYDNFRDGQAEIISHILESNDVLGIMPTGAGKSICYQVPAMILEGMTIVISPLISLMKDQVQSLQQVGIPAAFINSSLSYYEYQDTLAWAQNGAYKILYVAPERLSAQDFLELSSQCKISMVTIDEAHCVSQWGQDFRPSYLKIADYIAGFGEKNRPIVSAFTATATTHVREDIVKHLQLADPFTLVTGFDRTNLYYEVRRDCPKLPELKKILATRQDKSGIVYCSTRKQVEEVCDALCQDGYAATRYHAGLEERERHINQDDFLYDRKTVMIATNAFGMGIDKSNVSYVIHYNMPKSLEHYYQEAGRAGRDGSDAECILLYNGQDVRMNQFLIEKSQEANDEVSPQLRAKLIEKDKELLSRMTIYASTHDCLRNYILKYFGEHSDVYCGNCYNCNTEFENVDVTVEAQKIVSCVYRLRTQQMSYAKAFGKTMIADILKGSKSEKIKSQGFDQLSTYGIMAETPKRRIIDITDHLIAQGYLAQSEGKFTVVELTQRYKEITSGKSKVEINLPKHTKDEIETSRTGGRWVNGKFIPSSGSTLGVYDAGAANAEHYDKLLPILKGLRLSLAKEAGVPAFVIFSDATLSEMCKLMPQTEQAFLNVSGVGKVKMERYGEAFISEITQYLSSVNQ